MFNIQANNSLSIRHWTGVPTLSVKDVQRHLLLDQDQLRLVTE